MNAIFGAPLIEITPQLMPVWQRSLKRLLDIFISVFVMLLLSPLYIFTSLGVRLTSRGPLLYSHERIGLHGQPFRIYKFRSMIPDAEKEGPQLSSQYDQRVTKFGRWMRKIRLDEIPQFFNVLMGDMSIVGPRPERQYFIDQIMEYAPHYRHLHKVRPGITSWGQVTRSMMSSAVWPVRENNISTSGVDLISPPPAATPLAPSKTIVIGVPMASR